MLHKTIKTASALIILGLFFIASCTSNDDDGLTMVYSFTTESDSDLTVINNSDDTTKMQNLFLNKKWFATKTFSGSTVAEVDTNTKNYFDEVVNQANTAFAEMTLNGNCKFTYKCTRSNTTTDTDVEIAKMEWKYLKTK